MKKEVYMSLSDAKKVVEAHFDKIVGPVPSDELVLWLALQLAYHKPTEDFNYGDIFPMHMRKLFDATPLQSIDLNILNPKGLSNWANIQDMLCTLFDQWGMKDYPDRMNGITNRIFTNWLKESKPIIDFFPIYEGIDLITSEFLKEWVRITSDYEFVMDTINIPTEIAELGITAYQVGSLLNSHTKTVVFRGNSDILRYFINRHTAVAIDLDIVYKPYLVYVVDQQKEHGGNYLPLAKFSCFDHARGYVENDPAVEKVGHIVVTNNEEPSKPHLSYQATYDYAKPVSQVDLAEPTVDDIPIAEKLDMLHECAYAISGGIALLIKSVDESADDSAIDKDLFKHLNHVLSRIPMLGGYGKHQQLLNKLEKFIN